MYGLHCTIYQPDVTVHDSSARPAVSYDLEEVGRFPVTDNEGIEIKPLLPVVG